MKEPHNFVNSQTLVKETHVLSEARVYKYIAIRLHT